MCVSLTQRLTPGLNGASISPVLTHGVRIWTCTLCHVHVAAIDSRRGSAARTAATFQSKSSLTHKELQTRAQKRDLQSSTVKLSTVSFHVKHTSLLSMISLQGSQRSTSQTTSIGKYGDISPLRSRKSWRSHMESWNAHLPLVSGLLYVNRVKVVDDSVGCLMREPIGAG